jgi:pyruvate/2-oxoglutarate dehydrogenase complex dihydrolipoamide acyltransferase (E2) component
MRLEVLTVRPKVVEIKMPWLAPLEEPDIQVAEWLVTPGTRVEIDQDLLRLTVNGAEFILPAPVDGVLTEILVEPEEVIATGQVLAMVDWGV